MEERKVLQEGYKTIPVDGETARKLLQLCEAYEMGKRAQGAMVRKLVNAEWEKLAAVKLLPVVQDGQVEQDKA